MKQILWEAEGERVRVRMRSGARADKWFLYGLWLAFPPFAYLLYLDAGPGSVGAALIYLLGMLGVEILLLLAVVREAANLNPLIFLSPESIIARYSWPVRRSWTIERQDLRGIALSPHSGGVNLELQSAAGKRVLLRDLPVEEGEELATRLRAWFATAQQTSAVADTPPTVAAFRAETTGNTTSYWRSTPRSFGALLKWFLVVNVVVSVESERYLAHESWRTIGGFLLLVSLGLAVGFCLLELRRHSSRNPQLLAKVEDAQERFQWCLWQGRSIYLFMTVFFLMFGALCVDQRYEDATALALTWATGSLPTVWMLAAGIGGLLLSLIALREYLPVLAVTVDSSTFSVRKSNLARLTVPLKKVLTLDSEAISNPHRRDYGARRLLLRTHDGALLLGTVQMQEKLLDSLLEQLRQRVTQFQAEANVDSEMQSSAGERGRI